MSFASQDFIRIAVLACVLSFAGIDRVDAQEACGPDNPRDFCIHMDTAGVGGIGRASGRFGSALAFGDFNGDGFDDLAIAAVGQPVDGAPGAGEVLVLYGSAGGLVLTGDDHFDQRDLGEDAEADDAFGAALAGGDFNDDGYEDLAIGVPFEDFPGCPFGCHDAGAVQIILGGVDGLDFDRTGMFTLADVIISVVDPHDNDEFGSTLFARDYDLDGFVDLMVGAPGDGSSYALQGNIRGFLTTVDGIEYAGGNRAPACSNFDGPNGSRAGTAIAMFRLFEPSPTMDYVVDDSNEAVSAPSGLSPVTVVGAPFCEVDEVVPVGGGVVAVGFVDIEQSDLAPGVDTLSDDHFGSAVAISDFDHDGFDDLATSAPDRDHGADPAPQVDSGRIYVGFGPFEEGDPDDHQDFGRDDFSGNLAGTGDRFGAALLAGNFEGDEFADLAVGVPGFNTNDRGMLMHLRGSTTGLIPISGGADLITENRIGGIDQANAHFGSVLAVGDVDGDGIDEVAIGVPDKDVNGEQDAGMVYVTKTFQPEPPTDTIFADGFDAEAS